MVVAPKYPLQHAHTGSNDPMEMIDTEIGRMERWRADALLVGETSGLAELQKQIYTDAVAVNDALEERERSLTAREDAVSSRERQVAVHATRIAELAGRVSVEMDRLHKIKADAEREPIALPPDNRGKLEDAAIPGEHVPEGGLHDIPPKDPEATTAKTDEMPAGGDLYLKTPIPIPTDEAEFPDPELPKPPETHPEPISVGPDKE